MNALEQAAPNRPWLSWLTSPQTRWLTTPLLAFALTRLVVFAGAYLSDAILPMLSNDAPSGVVSVWNRWDTVWYAEIAEEGYSFTPGEKSSVAFFPLYPLLIRVLKPIVGDAVAAGLLISNLTFLVALILLYRLTELHFESRAAAGRAVFAIAVVPTAFFFSAAYTESLFLLLSLGAAYYAKRGRWAWAAACGGLASATRSFGVLMLLVVGYEWLARHGWTVSRSRQPEAWRNLRNALRRDWRTLAVIGLIPSGLLVYMAYLALTFGDPLAFWTAQAAWGFENIGPLGVIVRDLGRVAAGELPYFTYLNIAAFLAVLWMVVPISKHLGAGYALYTGLSVLIPMSSRAESMMRYALVLFPVYIMLGCWGRTLWFDRSLRITGLPFLGLFTALFVKGVFIG